MEIFGVGPAELVLILVVVLLIFGPDQLPEIAKKLGKATRDVRRALTDINGEVNDTLKPFQDLKDLKDVNLIGPGTRTLDNLLVAEDPAEQKQAGRLETATPAQPPEIETPPQSLSTTPMPPHATDENSSTRG
ncbi:MAG: twin-arginine translocase TatA/TatE family subunit [Anaerolineae bacterium]